ncbi:hypothetical protein ACTL6U_19155 [Rhodovibrionaceae bacterium A322]
MAKKARSVRGPVLALLVGLAFLLLALVIAYLNHQQLAELAEADLPLGFFLILSLGGGGLVCAFLLLGYLSRRSQLSNTTEREK